MESAVAEHDSLALVSLLEKVYQDEGYDFRDYKCGTVVRRLARRLHATGTGTYLEYMHFLDAHPEEYQKLADELTIKVSGFFRSQDTFKQLAKLVLPELLSYKEVTDEGKIRFWSVACASGEEPYSIAILLAEFLGQRRQEFDISIYASDISLLALKRAQSGIYSLHDLEGLSDAIKDSYFTHNRGHYEIIADIRQMVKLSRFDLTSTTRTPLTGLDCVFCCNVLIYWQRHLQERVLKMMYDALDTPGYLVLGEVETPTNDLRERLVCLDSRAKIYKKDTQL